MNQLADKHEVIAQPEDTVKGFWLALSSFTLWGIFPIYFYALREVSSGEILAHRIIWSMLFLLIAGASIKKGIRWYDLITTKSVLIPCLFSTLFLTVNWLLYIWAVANAMAVQGSLGYFINPLVSVLMGVVILGERINTTQVVAILIAITGVLFLIIRVGEIPWIALILAFSFASYGLIHKRFNIDAFAGLTLETILSAPLAIGYMIILFATGENSFLTINWQTDCLLLSAGIITSVPLLLFLASLNQLRLSTVGLLQYVAPTLQFLVAVLVIGEPLSGDKLIAFGIIWFGLVIFSFDTIRGRLMKNRTMRNGRSSD